MRRQDGGFVNSADAELTRTICQESNTVTKTRLAILTVGGQWIRFSEDRRIALINHNQHRGRLSFSQQDSGFFHPYIA